MSVEYPAGFKSPFHKRKPICGVLAVAIAANVSFDVAQAACKASMHKLYPNRKRFGGRTHSRQLLDAMRGFGVDFDFSAITGNLTVGNAIKEGLLDLDAHYMIWVKGHVFTLKAGYVIDQSRNEPYQDCNMLRMQLRKFALIKGKKWA